MQTKGLRGLTCTRTGPMLAYQQAADEVDVDLPLRARRVGGRLVRVLLPVLARKHLGQDIQLRDVPNTLRECNKSNGL